MVWPLPAPCRQAVVLLQDLQDGPFAAQLRVASVVTARAYDLHLVRAGPSGASPPKRSLSARPQPFRGSRLRSWATIRGMREEDFQEEQYLGDDVIHLTDAPLWDGEALPKSRRTKNFKNRHLLPAARVRLLDYFDTGRTPPKAICAAVRHTAWEDLEVAGGPLDAVGDRLYVLEFRSMVEKLSYIKVGRAENRPDNTREVSDRISRHESDAQVTQALLFRAWISRPCITAEAWEKGVKDHLTAVTEILKVGVLVKKEYFRGISHSDAVRVAKMHQEHLGLA
uniref:Uncharacterized protein n=2 Tax=Streptomyces sp. F2 TaxID=317660 RepID=V9Z6G2_9ACTN|nr:hypothetical protein pFRL4_361 [Streptomyces sp. F2]